MTLIFVGTGLLFVAIALPLLRRIIKPNPIYGFRVAATFANEWVWYEANAASGRDFVILGVLQVAVALGARGASENVYVAVNVAFMLVGVLVVAVIGWRRANRLLESVAASPDS